MGAQDPGTRLPQQDAGRPLLTTWLKLVLMSPGARQFTLMFLPANSVARFLVRPSKAVLLTL